MDNGMKMIILENDIKGYAEAQLKLNGLTPSESTIVMKTVYHRFLEELFNRDLMSRVQVNREPSIEQRSGTAEDLKDDLLRSGFTPAETEGEEEDG